MKLLRITILLCILSIPLWSQNITHLNLKTVDGKRFAIKEHLGKGPIVVAFWATWCKPCRKELPALQSIYEKFKDDGLIILAISQDTPRSLSKVKSYVRSSKLPYIFLLDPNGEQSTKLFVKDIPYTLLTNKEGKVVYTHRGYREGDEKELEEKIKEIFASGSESEKDQE